MSQEIKGCCSVNSRTEGRNRPLFHSGDSGKESTKLCSSLLCSSISIEAEGVSYSERMMRYFFPPLAGGGDSARA